MSLLLLRPFRRSRRAVARGAVVFGLLAAVGALALPAGAVMPGANGRISFARLEADGSEQLWVANSDLSNAQQLSFGPGSSIFSDWRPDGQRIVFDSDRASTEQEFHVDVYTMAPDGSDVVRLTDVGFNGEPAYSPDGSEIVFESDLGNFPANEGIYLMNADGSNLRRITTTPFGAFDAAPELSPDGTKIAFERQLFHHIDRGRARFDAGGISAIFLVNADAAASTV